MKELEANWDLERAYAFYLILTSINPAEEVGSGIYWMRKLWLLSPILFFYVNADVVTLGLIFFSLNRLDVNGVRFYNYCIPRLLSKLGVLGSLTACGAGCTSGKSIVNALTTLCNLVWLDFLILRSLLFSALTGPIGVENCSACCLRLRLLRTGPPPPSEGVEIPFTGVSYLGGYTASLRSAFTSEDCY